MKLGHAALRSLGFPEAHAAKVEADIRRRDLERLDLQRAQGPEAGKHLLHTRNDEPLLNTSNVGVALNPEAAKALALHEKQERAKARSSAKKRPGS
jgi:hypothetical protein